MTPLTKGKYTVQRAVGEAQLAAVYSLRRQCFGAAGGRVDAFDASARQVVVCLADGTVVASFRMSVFDGSSLAQSYAAAFYDLTALAQFDGAMLELGRFCIHPDHHDPDILRVAWAALTAFVDAHGIAMLFGCSSFAGTNPQLYGDAFAVLKARHTGPLQWLPKVKAADVYPYSTCLERKPDLARGNAVMPPLLRTYLAMGGWVSDHAVVDHDLGTLHVFTALEIGAIPAARKRLLRALV